MQFHNLQFHNDDHKWPTLDLKDNFIQRCNIAVKAMQ